MTSTLSSEVLALLEAAMSTKVESGATIGFTLALLEYAYNNRVAKNGKPRVLAPVSGHYFSSSCPLIDGQSKLTTIEEATSFLTQMAEWSESTSKSVLGCTVVFDFKTLASIIKTMKQGGMTYATISLSKVHGIHRRLVNDKFGQEVTALSIDMYDRESIQVTAASNPDAASAIYCADPDRWFAAVTYTGQKNRAGYDKWKSTVNTAGTTTTVEPTTESLDDLEDETVG